MRNGLLVLFSLIFLVVSMAFAQDFTDGQEGTFVGQVFISVSQIFPPGFLESLPEEARKKFNVVGDRTVGPPAPLGGATVKLGNLESYSNNEGYFSFNSIPAGIREGTIFRENNKTQPIGSFPIEKLTKKGNGKIEPIIIKLESDVTSHLAGMNG